MNLLILHNKVPYPPKDGGSIAVFSLAESLSNFFTTDFLCINTKKHRVDLNLIPKEIAAKINFSSIQLDTDIHWRDMLFNLLFSKKPYNAQRFIAKEFKQKLSEVLRKKKYDHVLIEGLYMCPYIEAIRELSDAKISYRAHNIEHLIWERSAINSKAFAKKFYLKILAKRLKKFELSFLNRYDFLIPISDKDADYLSLLGNRKPVFTYTTSFRLKEDLKNTNLNCNLLQLIAALDWQPNQEGLCWFFDSIWKNVYKQFPEIKLSIAGRNAPDWLIKRISKEKNLVFLGEIEEADNFFRESGIFIVPIVSGSGVRIKILEAMTYLKPIITSSVGAEGLNLTHKKEVFIANDANAFIEGIEFFRKSENLKEIQQNIGMYLSNNFDNLAKTKELVDFIQKK